MSGVKWRRGWSDKIISSGGTPHNTHWSSQESLWGVSGEWIAHGQIILIKFTGNQLI